MFFCLTKTEKQLCPGKRPDAVMEKEEKVATEKENLNILEHFVSYTPDFPALDINTY